MIITEKLAQIDLYDLDGMLSNAIIRLQDLQRNHVGKILKLDLRDEYEDGKHYAVVWEREENEAEQKKRLAEDEQRRQYRRAEYIRLREEFGD